MHDRLPKRLEKYLKEIAPHDGEYGYLEKRLSEISFSQAIDEVSLLDALISKGLIYADGEQIELPGDIGDDGVQTVLKYRITFLLAAEATLYLEDLPKTRISGFLKAAGATLAALGGVAAIANLILYVLWH